MNDRFDSYEDLNNMYHRVKQELVESERKRKQYLQEVANFASCTCQHVETKGHCNDCLLSPALLEIGKDVQPLLEEGKELFKQFLKERQQGKIR